MRPRVQRRPRVTSEPRRGDHDRSTAHSGSNSYSGRSSRVAALNCCRLALCRTANAPAGYVMSSRFQGLQQRSNQIERKHNHFGGYFRDCRTFHMQMGLRQRTLDAKRFHDIDELWMQWPGPESHVDGVLAKIGKPITSNLNITCFQDKGASGSAAVDERERRNRAYQIRLTILAVPGKKPRRKIEARQIEKAGPHLSMAQRRRTSCGPATNGYSTSGGTSYRRISGRKSVCSC